MSEFDIVIGLETHIELNTRTKVFCGCKNEFGGEPNSHCCPVCIGLPGALPTLNREAVKKAVKIGLATSSKIATEFVFDRKHYFYPDLAKAYQITQGRTPICTEGFIEIEGDNGNHKKIRLHQIHLEEDAGKLIHDLSGKSYVDYNRGGVPLIEIVSEPDLSSAKEAINYLNYIKELVKHIGISECRMEQGQLRCDVNVSIKPAGEKKFGTRVEMKNLNSFKAIERAINFEVERQLMLTKMGERIVAETRRWDDETGQSFPMRSKEGAKDYRYMPEPDLPLTVLKADEIEEIKAEMPLLPREIKAKLVGEYGITEYDANLIAKSSSITNFFFEVAKNYTSYRKIANWINSEINKKINQELMEEIIIPISPVEFAKLLHMVDNGEVSQMGSRTLMLKLWDEPNRKLDELVDALGLRLNNNDEELEAIVRSVIENNPKAVDDTRAGKNTMPFFIGQVMKATRGQADAGKVNVLVQKLLK